MEPTEQGGGRAEKGNDGSRANKGRPNLKMKARTRMWSRAWKKTNWRQLILSRNSIRRSRINFRSSGRKGSGRGAKITTPREPTRVLWEDKPTKEVEMRGTGGAKKRWIGGVEEC